MSTTWDTTPQAALGVCVSPDQLVPGDAVGMHAYADRLRRVADGAARVGWLLSRVDAGALHGDYGTALRTRLASQPAPYQLTATALPVAARAVADLADTITRARLVARQAVAMVGDAELDSRAWQNARDRADGPGLVGPVPAPAALDPGQAGRDRAGQLLAAAQAEVELAAQRARAVLLQVARAAPQIDGGYWRGAVDTWSGLLQFARDAVLHPRQTGAATGKQIRQTLADPAGAVSQEARQLARAPKEYVGGLASTAGLGALGAGLRRVDVRPAPPAPSPGPQPTQPPWLKLDVTPLDNPGLWQHLFVGGFGARNKPVGYHHRPGGVDVPGRKLAGPVTLGLFGTYRVDGVLFTRPDGTTKKKKTSSFFPDSWSPEEVQTAVTEAWQSPNRRLDGEGGWSGFSSRGLKIEGYVGADGKPTTAWPHVPRSEQ